MKKIAYLYVFDTMADWEPGYAIAELHSGRFFKETAARYVVKTISGSRGPVTTLGGVRIVPDCLIQEAAESQAGVLILPGGDTWLDPMHHPIFQTVDTFLHANIPVAAICGATLGLAHHGFLNTRYHTSNALAFLKAMCPTYQGESQYLNQPAVLDENVITASGVAPLDFAYMILKTLEVFRPATLEAWYQLYQTGDAHYFEELLASLPHKEQECTG